MVCKVQIPLRCQDGLVEVHAPRLIYFDSTCSVVLWLLLCTCNFPTAASPCARTHDVLILALKRGKDILSRGCPEGLGPVSGILPAMITKAFFSDPVSSLPPRWGIRGEV